MSRVFLNLFGRKTHKMLLLNLCNSTKGKFLNKIWSYSLVHAPSNMMCMTEVISVML